MDIRNTRKALPGAADNSVDAVSADGDLEALSSPDLAATSKYFAESINQARQLADRLTEETSRRSRLAQKELDELSNNSAHVTAFRASGEFRRLRERVCNAEKNVVIERDRYARLLARYTALTERQTEDAKRIESLQNAMSEYQEINETLARELEQQGSTLERLVMSMRRARDELRKTEETGTSGQGMDHDTDASNDFVAWSTRQLQSAVQEASDTLESFDDVWSDPSELAQQTFPMGKRKPV